MRNLRLLSPAELKSALLIYLVLAVMVLCCCEISLLAAVNGAYSLRRRVQLLTLGVSLVAEHELQSIDSVAVLHSLV